MNKCEAVITPPLHPSSNLLFTTVFMVLCIIIIIGTTDGTELTFNFENFINGSTQRAYYIWNHLLHYPRLAFNI